MIETWVQYYNRVKDTLTMQQAINQYNSMMEEEYMADVPPGFLLQENLDYLLQEDGSRIYWN